MAFDLGPNAEELREWTRRQSSNPAFSQEDPEHAENEGVTDQDRANIENLLLGKPKSSDANQDNSSSLAPLHAFWSQLGHKIFGAPKPLETALNFFHIRPHTITTTGRPEVIAAIKDAAAAMHVDFATVLRIAYSESHFNPGAKNPYSSAAGLFQLTNATQRQMVTRSPALKGLFQTGFDRYSAHDNALVGAALAAQTRDSLARALGHTPSDGEIYLGHFLGEAGAIRVLKQGRGAPLNLSNAVMSANPQLAGMRTVGDLIDWSDRKMASIDVSPLVQMANGGPVPSAARRGNHRNDLEPTTVASAGGPPRTGDTHHPSPGHPSPHPVA